MKINSIDKFYKYTPSFGVNLQSKRLQFKEDDFYVRIKGYGRNSGWAKRIKETADKAVNYIRQNTGFEETLKRITTGVREANQLLNDYEKWEHTGRLRITKDGWLRPQWQGWGLITKYSNSNKSRYSSYSERLDYVIKHPLKNPYKNISLSRPVADKEYGKFIEHGEKLLIPNALGQIHKIYDNLYKRYIINKIGTENLEDVNNSIAEIRWIMAHATPWERGSDAISNTFIRSLYKAIGIKTYPLKKGISLDLEAFCTNLNDYKNNFPNYFEKKPEIIN